MVVSVAKSRHAQIPYTVRQLAAKRGTDSENCGTGKRPRKKVVHKRRVRKAQGKVIKEATVVLCTYSQAAAVWASGASFDLFVLDEASQVAETLTLVPLMCMGPGSRLVRREARCSSLPPSPFLLLLPQLPLMTTIRRDLQADVRNFKKSERGSFLTVPTSPPSTNACSWYGGRHRGGTVVALDAATEEWVIRFDDSYVRD